MEAQGTLGHSHVKSQASPGGAIISSQLPVQLSRGPAEGRQLGAEPLALLSQYSRRGFIFSLPVKNVKSGFREKTIT